MQRQYAPRVAGARTPAELRRILNLMVGELNSSHMGVGAPQGPGGGPTVGKLGLRFDPAEYESRGRFKIAEVIPLGPAAVTRSIRAGEYLVAVDGVRLGGSTNLDEVLNHTANRRVVIDVSASADGSGARPITIRPITQGAEKNLLYRQWVEQNRAYVDRASGGRLGYVHMADMSDTALTQLYTDLDADNRARDGVVVDVRNNNGGFVNVYAIDVLARRGYLQMTPRGLPTAPARTVLGQRSLERPTILLTNQHSLSDAEDFTEGYRTLKLGKIVGEPTSGWIIYTGSRDVDRRHDRAHAGHENLGSRRHHDGAGAAARGHSRDPASGRKPVGTRQPVGCGGEGVAATARRVDERRAAATAATVATRARQGACYNRCFSPRVPVVQRPRTWPFQG